MEVGGAIHTSEVAVNGRSASPWAAAGTAAARVRSSKVYGLRSKGILLAKEGNGGLVNGNATDEQTPPLSAPASRGFASPSEGPPPCVSPRPDLTLHADEISPAMPASPAGEGRQGQGASASWEPLLSNGPPDNGPVLEGIASPSEEPPPRASPRSDLTLHVAETPPASIPASPSEGTNSPDLHLR